MTSYPKRLIEVDLPIKQISAHARREKSIRHGHISTLHIWWARRPLAACRAVICASLWLDPADENCPPYFREEAIKIITDFAKKVDRNENNLASKHCSTENWEKWQVLAKDDNKLAPNNPSHLNILRYRLLDFIADFANWDNSTQPDYLETSRLLTQVAHEANGGIPDTKPLVVDPFAGGGAIPLEALRVGADAFASDLNPVAVLLNKVVLEYIPKYGQTLADEVRKWGQWVKQEAEKELSQFYPTDEDGSTPIAYLWARTIISEAPDDGTGIPVEVPLMRSMWLAKKKGKNKALRWVRDAQGMVVTETVEKTYSDGVTRKVRQPLLEIFEPKSAKEVAEGTVKRGSATCPVTGFTTPVASVRSQLKPRKGGANDARLFCVVSTKETQQGRFYRLPNNQDLEAVNQASLELEKRLTSSNIKKGQKEQSELSLIPNEPTPKGGGSGAGRAFSQRNYGMDTFDNLFTNRQLLALTTLVNLVNKVGEMLANGYDLELNESGKYKVIKQSKNNNINDNLGNNLYIDNLGLAEAVQTCLSFIIDKLADKNSSVCRWKSSAEYMAGNTFSRQALPIVFDFCESNLFGNVTGDIYSEVEWVVKLLLHGTNSLKYIGQTQQSSATHHPLPDDFIQAFISDPPYYDAVPYSDLSDFFYVWLKRTLPPSLKSTFADELTPKEEECIVDPVKGKDKAYFEKQMGLAMNEGCRILSPNGIGVIVFAHKSTAGWEAQLQAMVDAGWTITASWAIDTEMGSRLRAMNSAALASSIHLVCRPRTPVDNGGIISNIGDWRDILQELPVRIREWLPRLASEGVVGADAIFACLGPALEIYSRYDSVEKASGDMVTLREYLEQVWAVVSQEALTMIFSDVDTSGLEEDARLTAMWLWTLSTDTTDSSDDSAGDNDSQEEEEEENSSKSKKISGFSLEYDAARKIAQGLGVYLEALTTLVEIKGDKARLLPVTERSEVLLGNKKVEIKPKQKKKQGNPTITGMEDYIPEDTTDNDGLEFTNLGNTVLDQIHLAMLLFASGRSEALKTFLVDEGVGGVDRFWKLANALSALYPSSSDEKRWVDGVLARKKGLGF
ncbi:adenine-specific DNA methylase containing a Zn-ribbon (plasmid) [Geminocystis sp. NIES-3708]|uniref:DUF1156 domain-containing protein n=1 Tax=Geminocystis sp. NIES-3708 TaxID=1615909 RepID=UPI0005FC6A8F|nr:DUF1156 domain-containing protein [Geminocystis sp. NIES-3708]BAQ63186.1 adenine-specific DNA methylase containing a Zn-ribbon [Geminocystis sp. NIES-3708]